MTIDFASLERHWFVACLSRELRRKPIARTVLSTPLVLYRHANGIAAFIDRCPHRNARLSEGRVLGDSIQCPYHGWTFGADGKCRTVPGFPSDAPPGQLRVRRFLALERDGLVWVALREDVAECPPIYEPQESAGFDRLLWRTESDGALDNILENLLDGTHPHFVHGGIVRRAFKRGEVSVSVRRTHAMVEAVYTEDRRPAGMIPRLFEGGRSASTGRYIPPATAQLEYRARSGMRFLMTAYITPIDDRRARVFAVIATPRQWAPAWLKRIILRAALWPVLAQDRRILRIQQQQIEMFGGAEFVSTPLDVMRPHIQNFLKYPDGASAEETSSRLTMLL